MHLSAFSFLCLDNGTGKLNFSQESWSTSRALYTLITRQERRNDLFSKFNFLLSLHVHVNTFVHVKARPVLCGDV